MIQHLTYPKLLLIILLMLPTFSFAQAVYEGQVLNKTTELAVPNVSVILLKQKTGTQTNTQGYFNLVTEDLVPNDTLIFSSVGYQTYRLPVSAYQKQMFVLLEASNTQLNEVRIGNQKIKSLILDKFSYRDLKNMYSDLYSHYTSLIVSHTVLAKLFMAPRNNVVLTGIALGRQDFPSSPSSAIRNKFTTFSVHIIAQDTITKAPGKVLFTKTISLTDNSKWVDIDLSNDNLIIPEKFFFIAIEWMYIPYNEIIAMYGAPKVAKVTRRGMQILKAATEYRVYYQPFLVGYINENKVKPAPVYTGGNNKWHLAKEYEGTEIAISATIHY